MHSITCLIIRVGREKDRPHLQFARNRKIVSKPVRKLVLFLRVVSWKCQDQFKNQPVEKIK